MTSIQYRRRNRPGDPACGVAAEQLSAAASGRSLREDTCRAPEALGLQAALQPGSIPNSSRGFEMR
jgi:hypothetical protein